jgi:hypothetical protein
MRMDTDRFRQLLRWFALTGLAVSVLTACTVSVSGGVLGVLGSLGLIGGLTLLAGVSQTGCIEDPPSRDDAEVDVGPCLTRDAFAPLDMRMQSDTGIGPCLGAPQPDMRPDRGVPPDAGVDMAPDALIGPCLEPPPPADMGGVDIGVQPCLDVPEPDPPEPDPPGKAGLDRDAIFDKVARGLPADVVRRLMPPKDV